jgi:hypothetical protein
MMIPTIDMMVIVVIVIGKNNNYMIHINFYEYFYFIIHKNYIIILLIYYKMGNIVLMIIILIIFFIIVNYVELKIYYNDICYLFNIKFNYQYEYELNKNINNNTDITDYENIKVLIFSFDNRKNLLYLNLHNERFNLYSSRWKNISYQFIDKCDKNVYWCKIFIMLEKLKSNKYDYVIWTDSDVFIVNINKSIQEVFASYNSDIFISHDNDYSDSTKFLNAGIFAIKNSIIGIKFLEDCLNEFADSKCINPNGKLSGLYSYKCYEQGIMNDLIHSKYKKYTTILTPNIFNNSFQCNKNSFFLHNYGSGLTLRTNDDKSFDDKSFDDKSFDDKSFDDKSQSINRNQNDIYNCFLNIRNNN